MNQTLFLLIAFILLTSCNNKMSNKTKGSFSYDLIFLQKHDSVIVLKSGEGQIIISPKYQAKVFTSTADGEEGMSFGWINYKAFDATTDPHMNAYGGENRLWLGPEGGKFSLFFPKDSKMEFANWKTPAAFDTGPWQLLTHDDVSVSLIKNMQLVNYAGTQLNISVKRNISIIDRQLINSLLNIASNTDVKAVGYKTENILTNSGNEAWTDSTGMPCLWNLDMFNPSDSTIIVIPYSSTDTAKPATTDYFGEIPEERIKFQNSTLFFKADGKMRGKLGIHPVCARNIAGSYDAAHKVLTIALFDIDNIAKYLNQEWNTTKPPFSGDAVNAYNDGPLSTGGQLGPFYELESVSPAAFLQPGKSITHHHSVFHFIGDEKGLDRIARKLLGVSLKEIEGVL